MSEDRIISTITEKTLLEGAAFTLSRCAKQLNLSVDEILEIIVPLAKERIQKEKEQDIRMAEIEAQLKQLEEKANANLQSKQA